MMHDGFPPSLNPNKDLVSLNKISYKHRWEGESWRIYLVFISISPLRRDKGKMVNSIHSLSFSMMDNTSWIKWMHGLEVKYIKLLSVKLLLIFVAIQVDRMLLTSSMKVASIDWNTLLRIIHDIKELLLELSKALVQICVSYPRFFGIYWDHRCIKPQSWLGQNWGEGLVHRKYCECLHW